MGALHTGQTEFERMLAIYPIVLADFWAPWCGPCRMVAPIVEKLAEKYEGVVAVAKVDIDEAPELAARYRIQSIPTVILLQDGSPVAKKVGVKPQHIYEKMIDEHL